MTLKLILKLLTIAAFGYVLLCMFIYFVQERLIFFPEIDPPGTSYAVGIPVTEVFIPVEDARLHALWFTTPAPLGVILYFHGNGGSLRSWVSVAPDLVERGYDVVLVDYRGYGQSSGQISSERQFLADAEAVFQWVTERYPVDQVIIYGVSLGASVASWLAARHQPRLLILESPFYSLEELARRQFAWVPPFLLKYPLRSSSWIGHARSPVVIIHGTADRLIPIGDAERLAALVTAPLQFYRIEGGGHSNLVTFAAYHDVMDAVLAR